MSLDIMCQKGFSMLYSTRVLAFRFWLVFGLHKPECACGLVVVEHHAPHKAHVEELLGLGGRRASSRPVCGLGGGDLGCGGMDASGLIGGLGSATRP